MKIKEVKFTQMKDGDEDDYKLLTKFEDEFVEGTSDRLIRVLKGRILDVVLDIRKSSLSFGQHVAIEINSSNKNQLFIPHGFAHGYVVLSDEATILYKTDNYYSPDFEVGISPNDSQLSIDWQIPFRQLKLSDKDKALPNLADATFLYN